MSDKFKIDAEKYNEAMKLSISYQVLASIQHLRANRTQDAMDLLTRLMDEVMAYEIKRGIPEPVYVRVAEDIRQLYSVKTHEN